MNIPTLWIGEHPNYILHNHNKVIDSVINYYSSDSRKIPYKYEKLFLDNGAYNALYRDIELNKEKVIDVQETIDPDLTIPLDFPFVPGMSKREMQKRSEKTKINIVYWQNSTNLTTIPPLHAIGSSMLIDFIRWLQKYSDSDFVAVGSVITRFESEIKINDNFKGFFGDRQPSKQLVDTLLTVKKILQDYSDFKVHTMGFGSSPLTYHLSVYCGVDSTDCAGHRRKAAYGKIILPGKGERYICDRNIKFGLTPFSEDDRRLLSECECPICKELPNDGKMRKERLAQDWKLRAIHNKWVMEFEENRARNLIEKGLDIYERSLERLFEKSSFLHLFKYAKKMRNQSRIEQWVGGDGTK